MTHPSNNPQTHPLLTRAGWVLLALAVPLLWWVSQPTRQILIEPATFLFFHNAVEIFAIVVAMLIFVAGHRAILSVRKGAVVLLGVAFLGVGLLDLLHTLSYAGMPDAITPNSPQKSIFFWLAARLLAASALLLYVALPSGPVVTDARRHLAVGLMLGVVVATGYLGLQHPQQMPTFFIAGQGLTPLKIGTEWFIILIHLTTLGVLWLRRAALAHECAMSLAFAVVLSAVSELFFTMLGIIDKDGANGIGHLYKVLAYLYLFHATFNEALRRPLERMNVQHLREKVILNAAPDGVLWVDVSGNILMANPAMETLSGYPVALLLGQNMGIFLPQQLRPRHGELIRRSFSAPQSRPMGSMDLQLTRRDGSLLPVDISLGYFEDEGSQHAICYIRDLSERKKFEASLKHQATHDELTSLPNRWLFHLQLQQSLTHCERTGQRVAVLFVDLDDFKNVNDIYGHPAGDAMLVQVSVRMRQVLRDNDLLARLGGDEFAVLLTNLVDADEAGNVATRLLLALQDAYHIDGHDIYSGASMGIAFFPDDARDSDTLLRFADMAMYQSKAVGRGTYSLFSKELDQRVHEDMALHTRLKEAIASGGLELHYQPQVDVQTGQIVAAEALLRWHDAVLGQVPPVKFIPVAEMTGLILPLSDWVLDTACRQIASWMKAGLALRVAINVTAQQFRQRDLPQKVAAALLRSGADARWLDIEITESAAMSHAEQTSEQLTALVALGCRVALDDFGTGYSSLSYLKAMPVNKIKIDKSFMDGVPHDANDVTISQAIIGLAKNLGLGLVAEGVENQAQLEFLRVHGCETYQGWLFAKAMPAEELENRLRAQHQASPVLSIDE